MGRQSRSSSTASRGRFWLRPLIARAGWVAASFGQWLVPETDWLGDDWSELVYEDYYQRPIGDLPLERGEKLEQPLLKNAIAWLMEDSTGRRLPALTSAMRKALFADRLLLSPGEVKKDLDQPDRQGGQGRGARRGVVDRRRGHEQSAGESRQPSAASGMAEPRRPAGAHTALLRAVDPVVRG